MICVTGSETTLEALEARFTSHPEHLHEVRLDALDHLDGALDLVARHGPRLVVTLRPRREGGAFDGDEGDRISTLGRAAAQGARWIDVEHDAEVADAIPQEKTIRSVHDFDGAIDVAAIAREQRRRAAVVKVARQVDDATDLASLLDLAESLGERRVVIGMGPAGLVSRVRYRDFGSAWTYVAADATHSTAPGQLTLAEALHQGLPGAAARPFAALLGAEQVLRSPGPRRYPPLFRASGVDAESYVPVITDDLEATLALLRRLGLVAASVTMPLKAQAQAVAEGDALVTSLGAANSLRWRDRWEATNSDVAGVEIPLAPHVEEGATARILGAGGAAAAAAMAARRLGLDVEVSARDLERAETLVGRVGGAAIPWSERGRRADVLINATPVSGDDSPWPDAPIPPVVFDLALGREPRALQAQAARSTFLDAETMWIHQGAAQMSWAFDHAFDADALRG